MQPRKSCRKESFMSNWRNNYRSFYYEHAPEPDDIVLNRDSSALLVIDIQNTYLEPDDDPKEALRWAPFYKRMNNTVIPNTADMISWARERGLEVIFARIACLKKDGRDRSLSQKKPGFNYLLMPTDSEESQIIEELSPYADEISITKTTDSALTGTNLRLTLHNMGIKSVIVTGIFTDQCVSSTVRSLADESFEVLVVEDCCAAATDEIHHQELKIINMIYCHVLQAEDVKQLLAS
jgi:nicotinamidase-related amidase